MVFFTFSIGVRTTPVVCMKFVDPIGFLFTQFLLQYLQYIHIAYRIFFLSISYNNNCKIVHIKIQNPSNFGCNLK